MTKIRSESGSIAINYTEIKMIIKDYYQQSYTNKFDNLGERKKFLET